MGDCIHSLGRLQISAMNKAQAALQRGEKVNETRRTVVEEVLAVGFKGRRWRLRRRALNNGGGFRV